MKPFYEEGYFWWPDRPEEKYIGFLEFDPINGGSLKINHGYFVADNDTLENKNRKIKQFSSYHKIILGSKRIDGSGASWTLYNCSGYGGDISSIFYIEKIFVDYLFESEDKIEYQYLTLTLPLLEYWVRRDIIKLEHNQYYKGVEGYSVNVLPKETFSAKVKSNLTVKFCISTDYSVSNEYAKIHKKPYFLLDYKSKIQHDEIEKDLNHIRDFICLATSEPVYLDTVFSRGKDGFNESEILFKRKYNVKNFDKHPLKQILYFEDIEKEYNNVLQKWFEDYEQLKHIYEMFFLTTYAKQTLAFSFLSLAQALDSYSNIYVKELREMKTTKKIYKKYEDRIEVLVSSFSDYFDEKQSKSNFIKAVVETRHAISHGDSKEEKEKNPFCYEDNDLEWLFYGTKLILIAVFLRRIGLNDAKISECLKRDYRYRDILEGKYRFEENKKGR